MHRTQVIFEERQYRLLKELSERHKKSISRILRELLDSYTTKTGVFSLSSIEGIAEDREVYGKSHDKWLYRKK